MASMYEIIESLCQQKGIRISDLSRAINARPGLLSDLKVGKSKELKGESLIKIADYFHLPMDFFYGREVPDPADIPPEFADLPDNIVPLPPLRRVPRVGRIACGTPILAEENIEDYDLVPDTVKCDFTLICKGDSMINARIYDGDIVCIRAQESVENGEIAAVMVGEDEATLKRIEVFRDHVVLNAENPQFKPLVFWEEEMNKVRVIGKATHLIGKII